MEYLKINLENYGGCDVEIPLSKIEFNARVKTDADLRRKDTQKFGKIYKKSFGYVQEKIIFFPTIDSCEGPMWDLFREALVDTICKTYTMTYLREDLEVN